MICINDMAMAVVILGGLVSNYTFADLNGNGEMMSCIIMWMGSP